MNGESDDRRTSEPIVTELSHLRVGIGSEACEHEGVEGKEKQHKHQYNCHAVSFQPAETVHEWQ